MVNPLATEARLVATADAFERHVHICDVCLTAATELCLDGEVFLEDAARIQTTLAIRRTRPANDGFFTAVARTIGRAPAKA